MGFQRVVNQQQAPAVAGDFASNNPRSSVLSPVESGLVSASGQSNTVGYFAWASAAGLVYSTLAGAGATPALGFVARQPNEPSVLITDFLGEARMTLNDGMPVTLLNSGDYWANLPGATVGATVYADATSGAPTLDDNSGANPDTGFVVASPAPADAVTAATSTIAATTGILTVLTMASGTVQIGDRVTGTGVPDGTIVTKLLTGAPNAAATYQTNSVNRAAVAAAAFTFNHGTLAKISRIAA